MSIDKSIRQYYSRGQLVKPGPGRPGYQGPAGGSHGSYGGSSSPSRGGGGGGGGRDRDPPAPRPAPRPHTPAPKPAPTPTRAPDFITGGDLHKDPVAIDQGFVDTKPEPKTYTPPVRHHGIDTGEEAYEMVGGVKVPLSDRGVKGVDPREDLDRYFEKPGVDPFQVPEGERTIEDKRKIEDWERATDWDKVKDLSKKGYDFKEIQDAMEKGLLTKADPQSMKTNLLGRGLRSLRNIMPGTGLERSLLSNLTKNVFSPTEGGLFNLKGMATGALKSMALKKLGLGALNPILGIASLFGFNPFKGLMNKFARKPAFDIEAASKLGLHANRFPTDMMGTPDTLTARGPKTTAEKIATGETDLAKLITGENEFKDIEGQQAKLQGLALGQMRVLEQKQGMEEHGGEKFTPKDQRMLDKLREMDKEEKVYKMPILTAAHGGRIDRPLMGRRRDI